TACGAEAAGCRPSPARRIVQFGVHQKRAVVVTSSDEHLVAVGQHRRVKITCGGAAAANDKIDRGPLSSQRRAQQRCGSGEKEKNRANRELLGSVKEGPAQGRQYDEKETSPQRRAVN